MLSDQPLIPECPDYRCPSDYRNDRVSSVSGFSFAEIESTASIGSYDLKWYLTSHTPYQLWYHSVHGRFDAVPISSYHHTDSFQWGYKGRFHCVRMFGNNHPAYGCNRIYFTGDYKDVALKCLDADINIVTNDLHYDIDERHIGAPKNRIVGYFDKVEIETQGGYWQIQYPLISEVSFWGWPLSPIDTRIDSGEMRHLDWMLYYDEYLVENGRLTKWRPGIKTGELQTEIDWVRIRDMLYERDKRNASAGLKKFDEIKRESINDVVSDGDVVNGLMDYNIGGNLPTDTDDRGWDFFSIHGCFFRVDLADTKLGGRAMMFGPMTRIRIYPTKNRP